MGHHRRGEVNGGSVADKKVLNEISGDKYFLKEACYE
jgi:hypothetical protein